MRKISTYARWLMLLAVCIEGCSESNNNLEQCKKSLTAYDALNKKNSQKTAEYFARADSRINLTIQGRINKARKLRSMICSVTDSELECARTENNIYFLIQQYAQKWIDTFRYNPLDENRKIVDPVRTIWLVKNQALQVFGSAPESRIRILQFNFGDDEGKIIEKLSLASLGELLEGNESSRDGGMQ